MDPAPMDPERASAAGGGGVGARPSSAADDSIAQSVPEMGLGELALEDYVTLFLFWLLALIVFAQFFTRFALASPLAWTEELARFLLIYVGFLGAALAVRKNTHIYIELVYHFLPLGAAKGLAALVDILRTGFLVVATLLGWQVTAQMGGQLMSVMPFPMSTIYGVVTLAFALMAFRSLQVAWTNWREGYALVERLHTPPAAAAGPGPSGPSSA
ncbi:TRAP transporter small permease [soil metagenome]